MIITKKWLEERNACKEGIEFIKHLIGKKDTEIIRYLIEKRKYVWANWLTVRIMNHKQRVQYAVYGAESVLPIFERKYPASNRPRKAIEAAKKVLLKNTKENRSAARAVARAVAWDIGPAAWAAVDAVLAATNAVWDVEDAAWAAANAARAATNTNAKWKDILEHGIKLIEGAE